MKDKEVNEKVTLLKAGQIVEINGLMFSAKRCIDDEEEFPCRICSVDSACSGDILMICNELDLTSRSMWYLHLESGRRNADENERTR